VQLVKTLSLPCYSQHIYSIFSFWCEKRYVFAVHGLDTQLLDETKDAAPVVVGFNLTLHTRARLDVAINLKSPST
jgi:hypothetical protein